MIQEIINITKPKRKKYWRWILKIIYILFGLYFIIDFALFLVATPLLKSYLQNKINEQTNGLFSLNFENISIELASRRIALKKFELISDTSVYNKIVKEKKDVPALYNFSCNAAEIWGTSFYELFFKGRLKAKELNLIELTVELKKLPAKSSGKSERRDFVHQDLFPAISPYLSEVSIGEIKVVDGKFNLDIDEDKIRKTTHVGNISVTLYKFLLNEKEHLKKSRLFFSDDLQLNIDEYRVNLSDRVHFAFAQDLNISTKESRLTARNIGIEPVNKSEKFLENIENNYYIINAPNIEFDYFNIYDLYFNNDIKIGNISVKKPRIEIHNVYKTDEDKKDGISKSKEIDLTRLIAGKLNSILLDTLSLDNGLLNFYYNGSGKEPTYHSNSLSLKLFGFKLDDFSSNDQSKLFYADHINLNVSGFSAKLPDNVHKLDIASVEFSTFNKLFKATGIKMKPYLSGIPQSKAMMNIEIPSLEISGTDFYKLYHQRIFNISNLVIGKSDFDIKIENKEKQETTEGSGKIFLATITSNYLKQLSIKNFILNSSRFEINRLINDSVNYCYRGEAALSLKNFFVDESRFAGNDNNLFYSDQFKLKLTNYTQDLKDKVHQIHSKSIEISTFDSIIEITGLRIRKNENPDLDLKFMTSKHIFDFNLLHVSIKGIDINKAYNDSVLFARSILIFRPEISIDNNLTYVKPGLIQKDTSKINMDIRIDTVLTKKSTDEGNITNLLGSYYKQIAINILNIEDANLQLADIDSSGTRDLKMSGKLSAWLNEFRLNPGDSLNRQLSYSDNLSFKITDYYNKLFNKKYQLKMKQARFSSKDSVFSASVVRFFPTPEFDNSLYTKNVWTFYAPQLESRGTDISNLINENILDLGTFSIINPAIINTSRIVSLQSHENQDKEISKEKSGFPFNKIRFNGLMIKDGVIGMLKKDAIIEKISLNAKLNLQTEAFEIDSTSLNDPSAFINTLSASAKLQDISYFLPDSLHLLKIKLLEANTGNKTISCEGLYYMPDEYRKITIPKTGLDQLTLPALKVKGFRFDKMIMNESIVAKSISLHNPVVSVLRNEKKQGIQGLSFLNIDLNNVIKGKLKEVDIDSIQIDDASLNLSSPKSGKKPEIFNHVFADISNLLIDSLNHNKDKILNAEDVAVKIKDYNYTTPNGLYSIYAKELGVSTGKGSVYANSLNLNPNLERNEYARQKQKETNLSYLKSLNINVKDFNFKSFIKDGTISAQKIDINELQFHAYKNKLYPMDSTTKVALPLQYLLNSNRLVKIDTVNIFDSYLGHDMIVQNAKEDGFIDFTRINGAIYNLTNFPRAIENKENTTITASGYLMDKSLLTISFYFPLDSKYGEYFYGGELDTLDVKEVNPFIENLFFVSLVNGNIENLKFNISANEDYAEGKLRMVYHDLKIDLLNKKKTDSLEVDKRGLFSMVANSIIRNSNPKYKNGYVREGRAYFERNIYRSVFNYWIRTVISGMQSTLGFKSKQLKERVKLEKITSKFTKRSNKKTAKIDHRKERILKKQIEKEIKQEQRNRKKTERKLKKAKKNEDIPLAINYNYSSFLNSIDQFCA